MNSIPPYDDKQETPESSDYLPDDQLTDLTQEEFGQLSDDQKLIALFPDLAEVITARTIKLVMLTVRNEFKPAILAELLRSCMKPDEDSKDIQDD